MQNGDVAPVVEPAGAATPAAAAAPEEVTKHSFRLKVWRHLESSGLAMFPRPVYNRIPNYKGAPDAAARLVELDIFKNAQTVKVNPDKPQEAVRLACLENKKTLYVPVPRLASGFVSRLEAPPGDERKAVSRNGMDTYGKPIGIEDSVSLDLVVMGSVAVSREGHRIGKGRGYGDLEFGLMMHMKAIRPNTLVVTTVHDSQVFDTLPSELFGPHDVPIDVIVTPTQVIETRRSGGRPSGILWHLLSARRLALMPVLAQLREIEMLAGRACALKEVDTDVEERAAAARARRRQRTRSRNKSTRSDHDGGNTTEGEGGAEGAPRGARRTARRRNSTRKTDKAADKSDAPATPVKRRPRKPKPAIDFSVKISNITASTRVRDVKQALSERGVKPHIMVWKGFRGFCYLHFVKPGPQKGEGDGAGAGVELSTESVLAALAGLAISETTAAGEPEHHKPYTPLVELAPPRQPATPAVQADDPVAA